MYLVEYGGQWQNLDGNFFIGQDNIEHSNKDLKLLRS